MVWTIVNNTHTFISPLSPIIKIAMIKPKYNKIVGIQQQYDLIMFLFCLMGPNKKNVPEIINNKPKRYISTKDVLLTETIMAGLMTNNKLPALPNRTYPNILW